MEKIKWWKQTFACSRYTDTKTKTILSHWQRLFSRAGNAVWNPLVKTTDYVTHARTHCWKIKCWTGDWEQTRHFLSPFSFEFTWTEVREVKQILPSSSDVPLREVGLDVGGATQSSFWQLHLPLMSNLEENTVWDPHMGRKYVEFTFWKRAGAPLHSHASSLVCRPLSCLSGVTVFKE